MLLEMVMGLGRHARQHPVEARLLALGRQAVQGTVHGADDLAGVDLAGRLRGAISALGSAGGGHQAELLEALQDLGYVKRAGPLAYVLGDLLAKSRLKG